MKLYRVEASFSTLDQMGRLESVNLGPYMAMPQVIEAVNDTHAHNDSDLWINENEVISVIHFTVSPTRILNRMTNNRKSFGSHRLSFVDLRHSKSFVPGSAIKICEF